MSRRRSEEPVFDRACYRCGAEEDLVEDAQIAGLFVCRSCLERVQRQNDMIARGLEEEPGTEG